MMVPRTPRAITEAVRSFCRRVVAGSQPVYLDTRPVPGAALDDCFAVVKRRVALGGGERVLGWQIWEHPGLMIEAEFHAVWRDPSGRLRDITPKPNGISSILFLPDPSRGYEERQVNNIREPLWDTPEVRELIAAADARFEFMDRDERAYQHGKIVLRGGDRDEWMAILRRSQFASVDAMQAVTGRENETPTPKKRQQADARSRNAKKRARRAQR
jgi:hypothetical protein